MPPPSETPPQQHRALSYATVDDDDWKEMDMNVFGSALHDFSEPAAGTRQAPRLGTLPEDAAAACAAVEHMDRAIHGISMRGLGGSMNSLDTYFESANQTTEQSPSDDVLLRQFLNQALSVPIDEPMEMAEDAHGSAGWLV
jgi:hypothetical protein